MIGKKMKVLPQAIPTVSSACFNLDMRGMFVPKLNMNGDFFHCLQAYISLNKNENMVGNLSRTSIIFLHSIMFLFWI